MTYELPTAISDGFIELSFHRIGALARSRRNASLIDGSVEYLRDLEK